MAKKKKIAKKAAKKKAVKRAAPKREAEGRGEGRSEAAGPAAAKAARRSVRGRNHPLPVLQGRRGGARLLRQGVRRGRDPAHPGQGRLDRPRRDHHRGLRRSWSRTSGPTAACSARRPSAARPVTVHMYVKNVDALVARAEKAGATVVRAPQDEPYGDRAATLRDPFGHRWMVASKKEDVSKAGDGSPLRRRLPRDLAARPAFYSSEHDEGRRADPHRGRPAGPGPVRGAVRGELRARLRLRRAAA